MNRTTTATMLAACLAIVAAGVYWIKYEDWVTLPRARALVSDKLRDPASTQFRNDGLKKNAWLCGEINTKNGSGGYTGFTRFISQGRPHTYSIEGIGYLDNETHEQMMARLDKEIARYKTYKSLREDIPTLQMPDEGHIKQQAMKDVFEDNWKEYCMDD